jgi:hypothetical protein
MLLDLSPVGYRVGYNYGICASDLYHSMASELPKVLPFPLYHGTSTLWREWICAHGLGGKNIVGELRAVEFLQEAVALLDSLYRDSWPEKILGEQFGLRAMESQQVTGGGFNFRHAGGVYLTPSRSKALQYALSKSNTLGSEIISTCERLYRFLISVEFGSASAWLDSYPQLLSVFQRFGTGSPLIIRIDAVRLEDLLAENASSPSNDVARLLDLLREEELKGNKRNWAASEVLEIFGQSANFQATVAFLASELHFEEFSPEEVDALRERLHL